jgi:hypothetical protein
MTITVKDGGATMDSFLNLCLMPIHLISNVVEFRRPPPFMSAASPGRCRRGKQQLGAHHISFHTHAEGNLQIYRCS